MACDVTLGRPTESGGTCHGRLLSLGLGGLHPRRETIMQTARLLVVDDLECMRALLGEVLSFYGYEVLTAASVPEAEAIRQHVGRVGLDLVITDLRLTHLPHAREGYDLIQRWHDATPWLPFILMGGDLRREDVRALPSRGVWCLHKPFETAALLTTIHEALRKPPEALAMMAPPHPTGWGTGSYVPSDVRRCPGGTACGCEGGL